MSLFFRLFKRWEFKANKAYCLEKIMQIYHNNLYNDTKIGHTFNGLLIDIYSIIYNLPLEYTPYYVETRRDHMTSKMHAITLFYNYKKSHARITLELDTKRDKHCYVNSFMNITKDMRIQSVTTKRESVDKVTITCIKSILDKFFTEAKHAK